MSYRAFTTTNDQILTIRELAASKPELINDLPDIQRIMQRQAPAKSISIESGVPLTIMIDCSGSTRGMFSLSTVLSLRSLGDALTEAGRPFEILGFTTSAWKGGKSRLDWIDAGMPKAPGRVTDLLHIVFKDMEQDWAEARDDLDYIAGTCFKKENVDGEALLWAQSRIEARGGQGAIIVITDGVPFCEMTRNLNYDSLLGDHLKEVLGDLPVPCHAVSMQVSWGETQGYTEYTEALSRNYMEAPEYAHIMIDSFDIALKAMKEKELTSEPGL